MKFNKNLCLGIESTAHTFSVGIIDFDGKVYGLVNDMYIPEKGGLHPVQVKEQHLNNFMDIIRRALSESNISIRDVDLIAFSQSPGLGPVLKIGALVARILSQILNIPIVGVNHCIAHVEIGRLMCNIEDPLAQTRIRILLSSFDLGVKYATSASVPNRADFIYKNCIINTWQFSVAQSDIVTCTFDIIGTDRIAPDENQLLPPCRSDSECTTTTPSPGIGVPSSCQSPGINTTRIVTWNDVRVELSGGRFIGETSIGGEYIRSFEANINNDAERYFTLNTKLTAQAVAPRKREINGNVVIMGRNDNLGNIANTNQLYCSEQQTISFGYDASGLAANDTDCPSGDLARFNTVFINCIFEIETMSLTNDLFETTVNWFSLPASGSSVCDPMITKINTAVFAYETAST